MGQPLSRIRVASKQASNTVCTDEGLPERAVFIAPEPTRRGIRRGSVSLPRLTMVHFSSLRGRADLLPSPLHFAVSLKLLIGL